ncbi:hypothetical protein [Paenibacillus lactis]|uniref:hypothetical protein n=1 Tax=Paenibacillus lactis TaxID=228574 RepID=UPI003D72B991
MENYINIKDTNFIKVLVDKSCSMASVEVNGKCLMMGNFWDFHNGCHGMNDIPSFRGYNSLVQLIEKYISSQGKSVEVIRKEWDYCK